VLLIAGEFRVSPEKQQAFADLARTVSAATRQEDGCEAFEFWADLDGSGRFGLTERWASRADLLAHREMPHVAAFREGIAELGIESVQINRYEAHEIEI
jgi:quinol monooxygenase YgiN